MLFKTVFPVFVTVTVVEFCPDGIVEDEAESEDELKIGTEKRKFSSVPEEGTA